MPATAKRTEKSKFEPLPDAPKPWRRVKPGGLHVFSNAISKPTRDKLWKFFHPKTGGREGHADRIGTPGEGEFQWYQRFKRFPKTAHFNGWHSGKYIGEEGAKTFEQTFPDLYAAATELIQNIKQSNADMSDVPAWGDFAPESISVMRHKPDWGLGAHYDNAHDEGVGMVLMLTISDDDAIPRKFKFDDAPRGREFDMDTPDSQAVVFGGECYDEWRHMSIHNKKQTAEAISMTIRLAGVCGSRLRDSAGNIIPGSASVNGGSTRPATGHSGYSTGAPAAMRVAHDRIRKKLAAAR